MFLTIRNYVISERKWSILMVFTVLSDIVIYRRYQILVCNDPGDDTILLLATIMNKWTHSTNDRTSTIL